ncbi:MAG: hypothetical protein MUF13_11285 [Akkermansiaceae bacterium]|nr:hypothetical protein [Akkermansiaceae bacterium]
MEPSAERPFCLEDYLPFLKALADSEDEIRNTTDVEYDAREDVTRLLRQIDESEAGRHPFKVLLSEDEIASLCHALRQHLA